MKKKFHIQIFPSKANKYNLGKINDTLKNKMKNKIKSINLNLFKKYMESDRNNLLKYNVYKEFHFLFYF